MASRRGTLAWLGAALALGVVLSLAWWWRSASQDASPLSGDSAATQAATSARAIDGVRIVLLPDGGVSADPRSVRIGIANVSPDDLAAYRAWLRGGREGAGPGDLADLAQVVRWIDVAATTHPDGTVVADPHRSEHLGAGADGHPVADGGVTLAVFQRTAPEGDAVVDHHVVADLGRLADHHAHAMVDEEAPTDGGTRMDLDAGEEAGQLAQDPGHTPQCRHRPQAVCQPV
mgnify:CR=1 FL=1